MQNNQLKVMVFDAGHVVLDFEWEEICKQFCARSGMSRKEYQSVLNYLTTLGFEHGRVTTEQFLQEINAKLNTNITLDEFPDMWNHTFRENAQMVELTQQLRKQYPVVLLSNTNPCCWEYVQAKYNFARLFDELILSYKLGYAKPEQEIYYEVLKRAGVSASECLFIDDLEPNVRAATTIGMQAIRFTSFNDLVLQLKELQVI